MHLQDNMFQVRDVAPVTPKNACLHPFAKVPIQGLWYPYSSAPPCSVHTALPTGQRGLSFAPGEATRAHTAQTVMTLNFEL